MMTSASKRMHTSVRCASRTKFQADCARAFCVTLSSFLVRTETTLRTILSGSDNSELIVVDSSAIVRSTTA